MAVSLGAEERADLIRHVRDLDGVLHAALDVESGELWIETDPSHDRGPVELAVQNRLADLGFDAADLPVRVTIGAASGARRRVRFLAVDRTLDNDMASVTVSLEWDGEVYDGTATGERGPAIELKTTALAALHALESLTSAPLNLRVIGVKPVRAFDSDLMVASLLREAGDSRRLVGAVIVSGDPLEAAAIAVLSALNRTLGNFLHTTD